MQGEYYGSFQQHPSPTGFFLIFLLLLVGVPGAVVVWANTQDAAPPPVPPAPTQVNAAPQVDPAALQQVTAQLDQCRQEQSVQQAACYQTAQQRDQLTLTLNTCQAESAQQNTALNETLFNLTETRQSYDVCLTDFNLLKAGSEAQITALQNDVAAERNKSDGLQNQLVTATQQFSVCQSVSKAYITENLLLKTQLEDKDRQLARYNDVPEPVLAFFVQSSALGERVVQKTDQMLATVYPEYSGTSRQTMLWALILLPVTGVGLLAWVIRMRLVRLRQKEEAELRARVRWDGQNGRSEPRCTVRMSYSEYEAYKRWRSKRK